MEDEIFYADGVQHEHRMRVSLLINFYIVLLKYFNFIVNANLFIFPSYQLSYVMFPCKIVAHN